MLKILKYQGCAIVAAVSLLASGAQAQVPQVPPAKDFVGLGITTTAGGSIDVWAAARQIDGKVAVCGAVIDQTRTNTASHLIPKILATVLFQLENNRLAVQPAAFNTFKSMDEAKAGKAGCYVTKTVWEDRFKKIPLTLSLGLRRIYD